MITAQSHWESPSAQVHSTSANCSRYCFFSCMLGQSRSPCGDLWWGGWVETPDHRQCSIKCHEGESLELFFQAWSVATTFFIWTKNSSCLSESLWLRLYFFKSFVSLRAKLSYSSRSLPYAEEPPVLLQFSTVSSSVGFLNTSSSQKEVK